MFEPSCPKPAIVLPVSVGIAKKSLNGITEAAWDIVVPPLE